jgi:hypothetical protein
VGLVVIVKTEEVPLLKVGLGLKLPDAPEGREGLKPKVTAPVNPCKRAMVTVELVLAPWTAVGEPGEAESEKSVTTSVADVGWLSVPLVPVIVNG